MKLVEVQTITGRHGSSKEKQMSWGGSKLGGVLEPQEGLFLEVDGKGERR